MKVGFLRSRLLDDVRNSIERTLIADHPRHPLIMVVRLDALFAHSSRTPPRVRSPYVLKGGNLMSTIVATGWVNAVHDPFR
jgi:hypothetical protein